MACAHNSTAVYDSRLNGGEQALVRDFAYIKVRRRRCLECDARFVTFELSEDQIEALVNLRMDALRSSISSALAVS